MPQQVGKREETLVVYKRDTGEVENNPYRKDEGKGNRKGQIRGRNGRQLINTSFRKVASIGVGLRLAKQANEFVGAYTGRRLRQERVKNTMQLGAMAYGIYAFKGIGVAYAAGNMLYQTAMHSIETNNENLKSEIARRRSGQIARSGSRKAGKKI